jgi:hypothetical protein
LTAFSPSVDLTNRPFTRFLVSALSFLDSYRMCFSYLHKDDDREIRKKNCNSCVLIMQKKLLSAAGR